MVFPKLIKLTYIKHFQSYECCEYPHDCQASIGLNSRGIGLRYGRIYNIVTNFHSLQSIWTQTYFLLLSPNLQWYNEGDCFYEFENGIINSNLKLFKKAKEC